MPQASKVSELRIPAAGHKLPSPGEIVDHFLSA